jgi:PTH1 family peptidyl-tRNA hydrolase
VKLVVGLGNPGRRYATTRHNVGFRIVERLARDLEIGLDQERFEGRFGSGPLPLPDGGSLDVALLEPQTFMNRSGDSVGEAVQVLEIADPGADLLLVFDDVDLPFGRIRIRPRGGSAGHRGLGHVIEVLGHRDFPRLRLGVGRPEGPHGTVEYVLQGFSPQEEAGLEARIAEAAAAIRAIYVESLSVAMNRYNRDPAAADREAGEES